MSFLGDVLKKTLTLMFLTMFKKNQNIVLTMHISDVFGKNILNKLKFAINPMKFATNCDKSAFF